MGLKRFVKVTDITNLSDARYCAGMGVDLLGFDIDPTSETCVSPELFGEITGWISGIEYVGEFSNASVEEIKLATTNYEVNLLQVSNPEIIEELSALSIPLIYKATINDESALDSAADWIQTVTGLVKHVIIASQNETLFDQLDTLINENTDEVQFIKSYNLSVASVEENDTDTTGIELHGSEEERPGFNDYGDLMDILEVLEEY